MSEIVVIPLHLNVCICKIKGWAWIEAVLYLPGLVLIRQMDVVGLKPVVHLQLCDLV